MTMVVPSYWGRRSGETRRGDDSIYDHPTPLDGEGTLSRLLDSLETLRRRDFQVVVLAVATGEDIREEVENNVGSLVREREGGRCLLFSYSHLARLHDHLSRSGLEDLATLVRLDGYSNVRNLCTLIPHLLGSEAAVLIDDDEIFEDPLFMDKAGEFVGRTVDGRRVLAVAGYYLNPDNDYLLKKDFSPWMAYWDKNGCLNRAFLRFISPEPRLKETPFVFGGNLVIHRDLFRKVPFDPSIPRGEDIDFLINARIFGHSVFLDNRLAIKHDAPPKTSPVWERVREDVTRFVFERKKLRTQKDAPGRRLVRPEELDPYPGEFLKDDLEEKIYRANMMLALDYGLRGGQPAGLECLKTIALARALDSDPADPFDRLLRLQQDWARLMDHFSSPENAGKALASCGFVSSR